MNEEGPNITANEDGDDDIEQDALSLSLDTSLPGIGTVEIETSVVTEEISDEEIGSNM